MGRCNENICKLLGHRTNATVIHSNNYCLCYSVELLVLWGWGWNLNCIILKNKKLGRISDYFLWNCCHVNIKGPPLWRVSIGSGNGLVSCEVTGPQWVTCIYVCMLNGWIYHVMLSSCFLKWTFSYLMLDGLAGLKPRALEFTYKANVDIAWQSWCYMARYEYPDWLITRIFLPSTQPCKSMFESNRT